MDWLAFAGSILSGLISGLFTFIGVKLTLKKEREKEKREVLKDIEEKKPRLEVVKYSDFSETDDVKHINNDCNVLLLKIEKFVDDNGRARFIYNNDALDDTKLVFVEYELKNTGLTEIEDVCISSNLPRIMAVFEFEEKDFHIKENLLNYGAWSNKRYIKPDENIKIRIYYLNDKVISSPISYPLTIWLHDINGRYWEQSLESPKNNIEKPRLSSKSSFIDRVDTKKAIDCFRKPYLW